MQMGSLHMPMLWWETTILTTNWWVANLMIEGMVKFLWLLVLMMSSQDWLQCSYMRWVQGSNKNVVLVPSVQLWQQSLTRGFQVHKVCFNVLMFIQCLPLLLSVYVSAYFCGDRLILAALLPLSGKIWILAQFSCLVLNQFEATNKFGADCAWFLWMENWFEHKYSIKGKFTDRTGYALADLICCWLLLRKPEIWDRLGYALYLALSILDCGNLTDHKTRGIWYLLGVMRSEVIYVWLKECYCQNFGMEVTSQRRAILTEKVREDVSNHRIMRN